MAAISDPLLGTLVGHYRIDRLIGEGGMGRVYAAVTAEGGRAVAIKIVAESYARSAEIAERFFAEAHAVNLIRHECIVDVIELSRLDDGRPMIVMELVEGRTLREIIRAGPMPLGDVLHIMIDVLAALTAAHAIGIIHRDLKPDNIMVTPSGRAKVLDFGIAKLTTPLAGVASPRTRTGVVLGTPHYMAPEQITGPGTEARSDVYSAGIVLFEAVTGRQPFTGATDFDVMRAQVEAEPRSPHSLCPEVPISIEQIILCALAKPVAARFSSAAAMADALRLAAGALAVDQSQALVGRTAATVNPGGSLVTLAERPEAISSSRRPETDEPEPERDAPAAAPGAGEPRHRSARPMRPIWIIGMTLVLGAAASIAVMELWRSSDSSAGSTTTDAVVAALPAPALQLDAAAVVPDAATPTGAAPPGDAEIATNSAHRSRTATVDAGLQPIAISPPSGGVNPPTSGPSAVAAPTWSMKDVQALVATRSWNELLAGATSVPPSARSADWATTVAQAAGSRLQELVAETAGATQVQDIVDLVTKSEAKYSFLLRDASYLKARSTSVDSVVEFCVKSRSAGCSEWLEALARGPSTLPKGAAAKIALLMANDGRMPSETFPFWAMAADDDAANCNYGGLSSATLGALAADKAELRAQAVKVAKTCYAPMEDGLIFQLKSVDTGSPFAISVCPLLKAHRKSSMVVRDKCP